MMLARQAIGHAIHKARTGQGMYLRDLSAASQVALGYLSEIERGRKEPSSTVLRAVAAGLGVTEADVLMNAARILKDEEAKIKEEQRLAERAAMLYS